MFTRRSIATLLGMFVLFATIGVARADTWAPPTPAIFGTESGATGCKVLAIGMRLRMGHASRAEIFRLNDAGREVVVRRFRLVNIPHKVMLINDGEFIVTIDTYGSLGYAHSIVIYNRAGRLLADLALEDFLSVHDIRSVSHSASSRDWTRDARIRTDVVGASLLIDMPNGRKLSIELATGRVTRSP